MRARFSALVFAVMLSGCGDDQPPQPLPEKPAITEQPASPPVQVPQPQLASPKPSAVVAKKPQSRPEPLPSLPPTPVDLSVPQAMIDELHLGEASTEVQPEPLLPPLFVEKPKAESNFQLNGRLLLNEQLKDDYVKSVDGAELQLQYKH